MYAVTFLTWAQTERSDWVEFVLFCFILLSAIGNSAMAQFLHSAQAFIFHRSYQREYNRWPKKMGRGNRARRPKRGEVCGFQNLTRQQRAGKFKRPNSPPWWDKERMWPVTWSGFGASCVVSLRWFCRFHITEGHLITFKLKLLCSPANELRVQLIHEMSSYLYPDPLYPLKWIRMARLVP